MTLLSPITPFRIALRARNIRLLLAGLAASQAGDWLYNLALLAFVYGRTHSSMWVGLTTAARVLPEVVFGPLGGVLTDRLDRRFVLLGSDAARVAIMALLTLVAATGAPIVLAPVLAALCTAAGSAYPPCVAAVLPRLAAEDELAAANAARISLTHLCIVAGPVFGAALLLVGSPAVAFAVNAATFAVGGARRGASARGAAVAGGRSCRAARRGRRGPAYGLGRTTRRARGDRARRRRPRREHGVRRIHRRARAAGAPARRRHRRLRVPTLGAGRRWCARDRTGNRAASSSGQRRALVVAVITIGAPVALLAVAGTLPAAIALVAVVGSGSIVTEVVADTALQRSLDPAVFARAYGLAIPACVAGIAAGALLAPVSIDLIGLDGTFVAVGVGVLAYAALLGAPAARHTHATAAAAPAQSVLY